MKVWYSLLIVVLLMVLLPVVSGCAQPAPSLPPSPAPEPAPEGEILRSGATWHYVVSDEGERRRQVDIWAEVMNVGGDGNLYVVGKLWVEGSDEPETKVKKVYLKQGRWITVHFYFTIGMADYRYLVEFKPRW